MTEGLKGLVTFCVGNAS